MAKATLNKGPVKAADAWDEISKVTLELTREEAKTVFTLLGQVIPAKSGPAGAASERVYVAIDAAHSGLSSSNNLYLKDEPALVFASR